MEAKVARQFRLPHGALGAAVEAGDLYDGRPVLAT